jgi:hypothetical protein
VVDTQFQRALDACLQILLVGARDFMRRNVLPFVLVTHSPAGNHGHLQIGPAKAAIFHSLENRLSQRVWQAGEGGRPKLFTKAPFLSLILRAFHRFIPA